MKLLSSAAYNAKETVKYLMGEDMYSEKREYYLSILSKLKRNYRLATYKLRPKPDFIIPGAMKSGTTSMYYYLSRHENVRTSFRKEVHFFDHKYEKGESWYRSNFPIEAKIEDSMITGESSPYYLFYPRAPERIKEVTPKSKLIVLLRDPAERAVSHYWHNRKIGTENLSMLNAFKKEKERLEGEKARIENDGSYYGYDHVKFSYLERGKYHRQLDRYYRELDEENILLLKSSTFFESTSKVMEKVCDFLGLCFVEGMEYMKTNAGNYLQETPEGVRKWLQECFKEPNRKLSDKYGVSFE